MSEKLIVAGSRRPPAGVRRVDYKFTVGISMGMGRGVCKSKR